jgi:hypothetical protein
MACGWHVLSRQRDNASHGKEKRWQVCPAFVVELMACSVPYRRGVMPEPR